MERASLGLPQASGDVPTMGAVAPLSCGLLVDQPLFRRGSPFIPQVPFLFWLIEAARPSLVVEIGVADAVSYFAACQAVDKLGLDAQCQGIGRWPDGNVPQELLDYESERYGGLSRLTAEDSATVAATLPKGSIDLLIIREPVEASLVDGFEAEWLDKLSPRSVVLLSETGAAPMGEAQRLSHDRLMADRPRIDLRLTPAAVAVLYGPQAADQLKQAAGLRFGTGAYSDLRHLFTQLGAAQQAEWFMTSGAEDIRDKAGRLSMAEAALQEAQDHAGKLATELAELQDAYNARHARTAALESELFNERERLARRTEEIRALQAQLAERTREVHHLLEQTAIRFEELATLTRLVEEVQGNLRVAQGRARTLEKQLNALRGSRTWRMTAPLRRLIRTVRRR